MQNRVSGSRLTAYMPSAKLNAPVRCGLIPAKERHAMLAGTHAGRRLT